MWSRWGYLRIFQRSMFIKPYQKYSLFLDSLAIALILSSREVHFLKEDLKKQQRYVRS